MPLLKVFAYFKVEIDLFKISLIIQKLLYVREPDAVYFTVMTFCYAAVIFNLPAVTLYYCGIYHTIVLYYYIIMTVYYVIITVYLGCTINRIYIMITILAANIIKIIVGNINFE